MLRKLLKKNEGFTLIEVVIVLAIAGLIMVVIFLAVGGAQRARRDDARKSDANRVLAAAEQFASNNNGTYPAAVADIISAGGRYLDSTANTGNFLDPSTGAYTVTYSNTTAPTAIGAMSMARDADCNAGGVISDGDGNREYAVVVFLEAGGTYCIDND